MKNIYRVLVSEVRVGTSPEDHVVEHVIGLKATIQPPVSLTQEAVSRFIKHGDLDDGMRNAVAERLRAPVLIGTVEDSTVIYAGIQQGLNSLEGVTNLMTERTLGLLSLMGIEAGVISPGVAEAVSFDEGGQ